MRGFSNGEPWFWLAFHWSLDQSGSEEKELMGRTVDQPVLVIWCHKRQFYFVLFCFKWRFKILWWAVGFRNLFQIESASPGVWTLSSVSGLSLRSSQLNCNLATNGVGRQAWCEAAVVMWRGRKGEDTEDAAVRLTTLAALLWTEIYPLNPNTNQGRDQSRKLEIFTYHSPYGL